MRIITMTGLVVGAAVLLAGSVDAQKLNFKAKLSGDAQIPPVVTETTGKFTIKFNREETKAKFKLNVRKGVDITQAHLHCKEAGMNGPTVAVLSGLVPGGFDVTWRLGSFTLADDNILAQAPECESAIGMAINDLSDLRKAMEEGGIYVNVRSEANPSGEIRGQVTFDALDTDGDGIKDKRDRDIDGDGILNEDDPSPRGALLGTPPGDFVKFFFSDHETNPLTCNDKPTDGSRLPVECSFNAAGELTISRPGWGGSVLLKVNGGRSGDCNSSLLPPENSDQYNLTPNCVPGPNTGERSVEFFFGDAGTNPLTCNGEVKGTIIPAFCAFNAAGELTIGRTGWGQRTALLSENADPSGPCSGSLTPTPGKDDSFNLDPTCVSGGIDDTTRKDATGEVLVDEWFSDLPWHQKLSTLHSNLIDVPFVMPFDALPEDRCPTATTPIEKSRCMLRYGIVNVMAMHRTDTLYKAGEAPAGQDCQDDNCVEVKLEVQRVNTLTDHPDGYQADPITNNEARLTGSQARVPSLGFAITEATIFAPWRPWYTGHYCGADRQAIVDSVCYDDYFTTQLIATQGPWLTGAPATFVPNGTEPGYESFCKSGEVACSLFLGKVDWLRGATEPKVVGCDQIPPKTGADPLESCQAEVNKRTERLDDNFNSSIQEYTDVGRYPWAETPKANLGAAIATNPFIGFYELERFATQQNAGEGSPRSLFKAPRYVLPKKCTNLNYLGAREGSSKDVAFLKDCAVNFEIHTSGFFEQWQELIKDPVEQRVDMIDKALQGLTANQYGRTMFMYAGVREQKIPASFKLLDDGMSIHDKIYGSSMFTQYLPMVNPADFTLDKRSYGPDFWHAFFMSNHMNQTPDHFIRGIRGRTLWHNEYRSNKMYIAAEVLDPSPLKGTDFEGKLGHVDFPAGFQVPDHKSPFHGNTCDSCHIRNGSGIPLMPNGQLPQIHVDRGMNPDFTFDRNVRSTIQRDYTYTNKEIPSMKMVLFDLNDPAESLERCDANDHTTPKPSANSLDQFYTNKIMNFFGNSLHVNQENKLPTYTMEYVNITADSGFEVVDNSPRGDYAPQRIDVSQFNIGSACNEITAKPNDVASDSWPSSCADVSGEAISQAIDERKIGFMHLLGRRLGNTPLIEMMPDQTIIDTQAAQVVPGCYGLAAGTRDGGDTHYRSCDSGVRDDCYISRWGWIGDRSSLEDQIANAAVVEMNITSKESYADVHPNPSNHTQLVRYNRPVCGPADASCKATDGNSDITEQEIKDMATYQRWIGIPQRSEYQVSSEIVQRGEQVFNRLQCSSCHVIKKIPYANDDNMLPDEERAQLEKLKITSGNQTDYPFISYLGTDLLLHDMGYLSQLAKSPVNETIRNADDGTVKPDYEPYIQRIRTPALKGLRFNRFVTDSNYNTTTPIEDNVAETVPGCDFLLHDGRACDAIEAAYLHDGPAIKKLGTIEALNNLSEEEIKQLRAFLYSL